MNNITLFTFMALLVSCVFSAPIDSFIESGAFQSRAERDNTTIPHVTRNDYPSAGDIVITFYSSSGDSCEYTPILFSPSPPYIYP